MTLSRPSEVGRLIAGLGLRPSRTLGQNFLVDGNILDIILRAAGIAAGDRVLEIGPGLGAVTERLLALGAVVKAVEKDRKLHSHLQDLFADSSGLSLVLADALDIPADELLSGFDKVVSNLPYSAGTRLLVAFAQSRNRPRLMVVTVQKEVAARLVAGAGGRDYGLLGLWLQADYEAAIVHAVKATCFLPRPAVDSAVVRLQRRASPLVAGKDRERFYAVSRRAFEHRRKKLAGALSRYAQPPQGGRRWEDLLAEAGIEAGSRPEDIAPAAWSRLASLAGGAAE